MTNLVVARDPSQESVYPDQLLAQAAEQIETYRRSPWLGLDDSERLRALRAAIGTLQRLQKMERS